MPIFYLHGGNMSLPSKGNKQIFDEISNKFSDKLNILIVCFSLPKENWNKAFEKTNQTIKSYYNKTFQTHLASDNIQKLEKQIQQADIIFLKGGNENLHKEVLLKINNLEQILDGKTIIGSSAGANIFSKYYFTNDRNQIEQGVGILDINTICHYNQLKKEIIKQLEANYQTKTYGIEEGNFIKIIK